METSTETDDAFGADFYTSYKSSVPPFAQSSVTLDFPDRQPHVARGATRSNNAFAGNDLLKRSRLRRPGRPARKCWLPACVREEREGADNGWSGRL